MEDNTAKLQEILKDKDINIVRNLHNDSCKDVYQAIHMPTEEKVVVKIFKPKYYNEMLKQDKELLSKVKVKVKKNY